jgi:hypothetical protein
MSNDRNIDNSFTTVKRHRMITYIEYINHMPYKNCLYYVIPLASFRPSVVAFLLDGGALETATVYI